MAAMDGTRALLRHTTATVAYRATRAIVGAPETFAALRLDPAARTPLEIVAHLADLFDWALSLIQAAGKWHQSVAIEWDVEVKRFYESLERFDAYLASDQMLAVPVGQIMQGPVADALTHIGQLTMLRRLAGAPVRRESYFAAEIAPGRVGISQPPPRLEF